jgi:hypothetical protein
MHLALAGKEFRFAATEVAAESGVDESAPPWNS